MFWELCWQCWSVGWRLKGCRVRLLEKTSYILDLRNVRLVVWSVVQESAHTSPFRKIVGFPKPFSFAPYPLELRVNKSMHELQVSELRFLHN